MKSVYDVFQEINLENGSNYKLATLKQYQDHDLLKRVLHMAHDKVTFTYGLSVKHWHGREFVKENAPRYDLEHALDFLEHKLAKREVTGNAAIEQFEDILDGLSEQDMYVALRVLDRDLKINMGRTQINKVFSNLIQKPVYMRCGIFGPKTAKDIKFPAFIQLKADGTYREAMVTDGVVEFVSRSGEPYEYPLLSELLSKCPDGHYTGELIVRSAKNRSESNGLINSDNPPHDLIDFFVWDYIESHEYKNAANKVANKTKYEDRFAKLVEIFEGSEYENLKVIENHEVGSVDEALRYTSEWMENDLEGGILKEKSGIFKDGTSKHQLKLKLEIDVDVRITGFQEGTPGTVREKTFGAMLFETDDGQIKGRTSGFNDAQLEDFNSRREEMIGQIMTVRCNDITRGRNNEHYALSHPRFIELRDDRNDTDTLERALATKDMAKGLK